MNKLSISLTTVALALGLAGCGATVSDKIAEVEGKTPTGSAFAFGLHQGYIQQAKLEAKEYDLRDAERWVDKAAGAGGGKVGPEELGKWSLPKDSVGDLSSARARLMAALAAGAAPKAPADTARAQVMFDCWVQEQEENVQPDDIRACRSGFETALARVENAIKPALAAAPEKKWFIVYFDTGSDKITSETKAVLSLVLSAAKKGGRDVVLSGHTDRAGDDTYNDVLSKKRVDSVAAALLAEGLLSSTIKKSIHGEKKPSVTTADGAREELNRRVEIRIE